MAEKPVVLLPEDIQRIMGKDAQRNNILAARMVSEMVKTTLGPKGMDKMLVSPTDEIIITNDGVTILEEMQIEHPAAKMMVEIAMTAMTGKGAEGSKEKLAKIIVNAIKQIEKNGKVDLKDIKIEKIKGDG